MVKEGKKEHTQKKDQKSRGAFRLLCNERTNERTSERTKLFAIRSDAGDADAPGRVTVRVFERNGRRTLETGFTYYVVRVDRPTDRPTIRTERTPQSEEKKKKDIVVDVDEGCR
jgi:hypothetical protein